MKYKNVKLMTTLLLGIAMTSLQAQQSTTSAGGTTSGSNGSVSFVIGQVFYLNASGSNGSVTEGVLQPYEVSIITTLEEKKLLKIKVYPVPTTDGVTLELQDEIAGKLSYNLFDISGKLLKSEQITSNETAIEMVNFAAGIYLLSVLDENKNAMSFKIIKN